MSRQKNQPARQADGNDQYEGSVNLLYSVNGVQLQVLCDSGKQVL